VHTVSIYYGTCECGALGQPCCGGTTCSSGFCLVGTCH
jgi:hypothetical protein